MCEIFISADPSLWEAESRSLRLGGVSTSLRLERMFWSVLEEIAARDRLTLAQLITKLYDELCESRPEIGNFTSFLRVCCTRYLSLQLTGSIPTDRRLPLRGIPVHH